MTTHPAPPPNRERKSVQFMPHPVDFAAFAIADAVNPLRQIQRLLFAYDAVTIAPHILKLWRKACALERIAKVYAEGGSYADVVAALEAEVERLGKEGL